MDEESYESEYKPVVLEDGTVKLKKKSEMKKGKKSKAKGNKFEMIVRRDLESKGWIVDKWSNNIEDGKIIPAKRKFNPFSKVMAIGTGFPDFIAFQLIDSGNYKVIGIEVKVNGVLSKEEKEKCKYYLERNIFSEMHVASKIGNGKDEKVDYTDVKNILERMR